MKRDPVKDKRKNMTEVVNPKNGSIRIFFIGGELLCRGRRG